MSVYVIDAMMGSGKTSAAIQMMRESSQNAKYLYVTPYITEVERIITQCPERCFRQPKAIMTKTRGIKHLLKKKENIVTTHALFQVFDDEIIKMVYNSGYTLIMDEVATVIEPLNFIAEDMRIVLEKFATVNHSTYLLEWHKKKYNGIFTGLKRMCETGSVGVYSDEIFVWLFPIKIFKDFRDTYLMTYMFDAQLQKYYYDLHEVKYKMLGVEERDGAYHFTENILNGGPAIYPIRIIDKPKLNRIGNGKTALSKTWYENKDEEVEKLQKCTYNYFNHYLDTSSTHTLWTTFSDWKKAMSGKGYTRGFAPHNSRATNQFRDRTAVAYLVNRYLNPIVKNFIAKYGITVNEDAFALCEMLQFIWRSAIRDGQPIDLYVPSRRMRTLLIDWLKDEEDEYSL